MSTLSVYGTIVGKMFKTNLVGKFVFELDVYL